MANDHQLEREVNAVSTTKTIDDLQLIKELEPLQAAWDTYISAKEVN